MKATTKPTLKELERLRKRIAKLELGLRIIQTWATCDHDGLCSRKQAMLDIRNRAEETLRDDKESS